MAFALGQVLHDNLVLIIAIVAGGSLLFNVVLLRRIKGLRVNLGRSRAAAEEAARAAALAHPGGIDPEAVIEVLRRGIPPSLENVYAEMRRREQLRPVATAGEETVSSQS